MSGLTARRLSVVAFTILAVAFAYYVGAWLGLRDELLSRQLTPLWPATGVALVAILLLGNRVWPGIAVGSLLVHLSVGLTVPAAAAIAVGSTLAPLCAAYLLRRVGFRLECDRLRDALALVFLGAFASMTVTATITTGVLVAAHVLPPHDWWITWLVSWSSNAMGVVVVAPVLLVARKLRLPAKVSARRALEAGLLIGGTFAIAAVGTVSPFDVLFLVFPFLFWAAWRFQLAGAAPCVLVSALVVILAAEDGTGPFAGDSLLAKMVTLQAFVGSAALTALLLAAMVAERNHTYAEIEQACYRLADVMSLRDRAARHAKSWHGSAQDRRTPER
ncbi:MASE1 domain-containing protein [Actinopolymorpha singaporensis]|uniref:Integral membrane sensor domain MASE1 n=1 Tax=Actinopolymorpha singaporensis TaxID=117157 RepID=A0A1H1QFT8_9ACTN|nr:MASE1 domain-containing protein [Actinopolymorpha singaporensis]SDS22173.1 Integral membrane sensor domain MASE1 [Actinopolymorpha singaporensis]